MWFLSGQAGDLSITQEAALPYPHLAEKQLGCPGRRERLSDAGAIDWTVMQPLKMFPKTSMRGYAQIRLFGKAELNLSGLRGHRLNCD